MREIFLEKGRSWVPTTDLAFRETVQLKYNQYNRPFPSPLRLCFKASLSAKLSYENDFDLHENETACRTHFHMKGFALRLVLKQRHKRTRKLPIGNTFMTPSPRTTQLQSSCTAFSQAFAVN